MKNSFNLKIYGVITIGPKGQIMIPKEAQNDIGFEVKGKYNIAIFDEKGFGIVKTCPNENELKTLSHIEEHGYIVLNTKYQFVIPISIRERLSLQSGDSIIVVGKGFGLGFIKNNEIEYLLKYIKLNFYS